MPRCFSSFGSSPPKAVIFVFTKYMELFMMARGLRISWAKRDAILASIDFSVRDSVILCSCKLIQVRGNRIGEQIFSSSPTFFISFLPISSHLAPSLGIRLQHLYNFFSVKLYFIFADIFYF